MWWVTPTNEKGPLIEMVAAREKVLLRNLMQVFRHDLSEFTGEGVDQDGSFGAGRYLDAYWIEESGHPFAPTTRRPDMIAPWHWAISTQSSAAWPPPCWRG